MIFKLMLLLVNMEEKLSKSLKCSENGRKIIGRTGFNKRFFIFYIVNSQKEML